MEQQTNPILPKLPDVPEYQECHNCKSRFRVHDLVNSNYNAQCCDKPCFLIMYSKQLVFPEQYSVHMQEDVSKAEHLLAMRYEDRGYDSSLESGKGKNAYKVYFNPDELQRSKERVIVAAFLKQFQNRVDDLNMIRLMVAKNFSVKSVLEQIDMQLNVPEKNIISEKGESNESPEQEDRSNN